jgi:hypothetical protein
MEYKKADDFTLEALTSIYDILVLHKGGFTLTLQQQEVIRGKQQVLKDRFSKAARDPDFSDNYGLVNKALSKAGDFGFRFFDAWRVFKSPQDL